MAGHLADAVESLKELVRVYGGHALGYYRLGQVYEEMGRAQDARAAYVKFLDMWSQADVGLPQLVAARERLAELRSGDR